VTLRLARRITPVFTTAKRGAPFRHAAARELRRIGRLLRVVAHLALGVVLAGAVLVWASRCSARGARWRTAIAQGWNRRLCRLLNLRITVRGQIAQTSTLLVANHISWLDIPCLHAVVAGDFVAKEDVARWPLIGAMAREAGTIFLRRGDRFALETVGDRMAWLLKRGHNIILFPEGTTTDGSTVQRFHSRLYQSALRAHAYVQAVAVSYPHRAGVNPAVPFIGDDNLARHLWALLAEPSVDVTLTFCPAVTAAAFASRHAAAEHTHAQIADALGLVAPCQRRAG